MFVMPACFNAGDTIYFYFDTYGSNGESITMSGFAVTDIEVYKNGNTTQRASDNGYSLLDTDGTDFDGTTGLHGFSIDTSDNSDAGFWVDGAQYAVNINAVTVNSQTVRFTYLLTLGMLLRPATAGRKLAVSSAGEADANLTKWKGSAPANLGATDKVQVDVEAFGGTAGTFSSGRPEVNTTHVAGTSQTARDLGNALPSAAPNASGGLITFGTGTGQFNPAIGRARANVEQFLATTLTETTGGNLSGGFKKFFDVSSPVLTTASVNQTGDNYPRLGAPAGASIAADVAAVNAKTTNLPSSPAAVGSPMTLADDAITAGKFDESTAFPLKSADSGSTAVARTGADGDTLETLSDQIDAVPSAAGNASAVRTELTAELAHLDEDVSSRSAPGDDMRLADDVEHGGAGASVKIKRLEINNAEGSDPVYIQASGSASGMVILGGGDGSSNGIYVDSAGRPFNAEAVTQIANGVDAKLSVEHGEGDWEGGGSAPTKEEIADAVWDEDLGDHLTSGSTGAGLNAAGSAGDPWNTELPGSYGAGTAGKLIGDNIDAQISDAVSASAAAAMAADTAATSAATAATKSTSADDKLSTERLEIIDGLADLEVPTAQQNAVAVLSAGDVDGFSLEQAQKLILAALTGQLSGAATTEITIKAANGSKTRITATVDADGNRTSLTLDAT